MSSGTKPPQAMFNLQIQALIALNMVIINEREVIKNLLKECYKFKLWHLVDEWLYF